MIRIYIGLLGSGKTLSMVRDMINDKKKGKKIITNLVTNFESTTLSKEFFKDFSKDKTGELFNCTLAIDELHIFLDSRRSTSKRNTAISYFILQTRKRGVTLRGTSQFFSQVEIRLRNVTDYLTECRSYIKKGKDFIKVTPLKMLDGLSQEEQNNLWIENKTYDRAGHLINRCLFKAKPYYKYYDTNQIIEFD
jgi:hypothetical protein